MLEVTEKDWSKPWRISAVTGADGEGEKVAEEDEIYVGGEGKKVAEDDEIYGAWVSTKKLQRKL